MYQTLSPFIAAFVASWLTHFFGVRSKQKEKAYDRRLEAVEAIHRKLTELDHYIEDRCNEIHGFKRGWFPEGSPESRKSLRAHVVELKQVIDNNALYLPRNDYGFQTIQNLISVKVEEPDEISGDLTTEEKRKKIDGYWAVSSLIFTANEKLLAALHLPKT